MNYQWHRLARSAYVRPLALVASSVALFVPGIVIQFGLLLVMMELQFLQPYARLLLASVPAVTLAVVVGSVTYRWYGTSRAVLVAALLCSIYTVAFYQATTIWRF